MATVRVTLLEVVPNLWCDVCCQSTATRVVYLTGAAEGLPDGVRTQFACDCGATQS